jgi:hypothetical protein
MIIPILYSFIIISCIIIRGVILGFVIILLSPIFVVEKMYVFCRINKKFIAHFSRLSQLFLSTRIRYKSYIDSHSS